MRESTRGYGHRFLDVTKAALFFAKGVILVEGVAEQLLVPEFARLVDRDLRLAGVTVINIGGVAFAPFADLFGDGRLPYRLAAISDSDPRPDPDNPDGAEVISPRALKLQEAAGRNVAVFLSHRMLEWDLARIPENRGLMVAALTQLKPIVGPRTRDEIAELGDEEAATAMTVAIGEQKGEYAQILAELIAERNQDFVVPEYIRDGIRWAAEPPPQPDPDDGDAADEEAGSSSVEGADATGGLDSKG